LTDYSVVAAAVAVAAVVVADVAATAAADFVAAVASGILVANCDWEWHRGTIERRK